MRLLGEEAAKLLPMNDQATDADDTLRAFIFILPF